MNDNSRQNSLKSLLKADIIQEIFFSLLGSLIFILILFAIPNRLLFARRRSKDFPKILLSIIYLFFLFIFILVNQNTTNNKFIKVDYKRNIILFSIFNFANYCILFFLTKFGVYLLKSNDLKFVVIDSYSNFRPLYFFNYYFLLFYLILPIILFEAWKKIYDEKTSFFISIISSTFLLKPFYIDVLIGVFFIIPFIFYYLENIKNKDFSNRDYIIAGILGSIILCLFYVIFLILLIYFAVDLILNFEDFKKNFKQKIIILSLILVFSCWLLILLFINLFFVGQNLNQERNSKNFFIEFTYFAEASLISFSGVFLIFGIVYILKKFRISRELRILGHLLISIIIFLLIALLGIFLNLYLFQVRYMQLFLNITIIASCVFYVQFFYQLYHGQLIKNYKKKRNFQQVEIFILIIIVFSQMYFNVHNIYNSKYHQSAIKGEDPDEVIDTFYDYEFTEYFSLPLERNPEFCLRDSFGFGRSSFYEFMKRILHYTSIVIGSTKSTLPNVEIHQ